MTTNSHDLDHLLKLTVQNHKLEGILHIAPTESPELIEPSALEAFVIGEGVKSSFINQDAISTLTHLVQADPGLAHEACVARGQPPVSGGDSTLQLEASIQTRIDEIESRRAELEDAVSNEPANPPSQSDSSEAIDFYEMSPFLIVKRGDQICTLIESTEGEDGTDVFGQTIASKDGKPTLSLNDASVHVAQNGSVTALCSGLLTVTPSSVQVSETLQIPHDVDFSTANINFPGDVHIDGGVMDNFKVRATGEVLIRKLVQSSTIEADKCITLEQGMAGKDKGWIIAHGELHAGYLESIHASVAADCKVDHEITNSTISICGELISPGASLRGGEITIAKQCELNIIGSVQGVETTLVLGSLADLQELLSRSGALIAKATHELEAKQSRYEGFAQSIGKPTPAQIEEQMGMEFEISELRLTLSKLEKANQTLLTTLRTRTSPTLHVHRAIYAKSVIYFPGYKAVFHRDLEGESVLAVDENGGPTLMHHDKERPLRDVAKVYRDQRVPLIEQHDNEYRIAA